MKKHENPKYLLQCGILEKWHDKTIHDFTNDDEVKKIVMRYVEDHKKMRKEGIGIYMYGANGSGKTLLLNIAFRKLIEMGHKVRVVSMADLITQYADGWYHEEAREYMLHEMLEADFFGIEEVGKEYGFGKKELPLAVFVLDNVLRVRLQRKRPTWITTNLKPSLIKEAYTQDIGSMMNEGYLIIQVGGSDYRKKIQEDLTKRYL